MDCVYLAVRGEWESVDIEAAFSTFEKFQQFDKEAEPDSTRDVKILSLDQWEKVRDTRFWSVNVNDDGDSLRSAPRAITGSEKLRTEVGAKFRELCWQRPEERGGRQYVPCWDVYVIADDDLTAANAAVALVALAKEAS